MRRAAVIGCGRVGGAAGLCLQAAGWRVVGLRRAGHTDAPVPLCRGDASDPAALSAVTAGLDGPPELLMLTANPGLRGGGDNRLSDALAAMAACWPTAATCYTGSTAVYGDAGGQAVDEDAPTGQTPRVRSLLAIERALAAWPRHLVLRVGGIVAAGRQMIARKLQDDPCRLRGDPDRPFSYCHQDDLVQVLTRLALRLADGERVPTPLNCVAPDALSYRAYARLLAAARSLPPPRVVGDDSPEPRRQVSAERLRRLLPELVWHDPLGRAIATS